MAGIPLARLRDAADAVRLDRCSAAVAGIPAGRGASRAPVVARPARQAPPARGPMSPVRLRPVRPGARSPVPGVRQAAFWTARANLQPFERVAAARAQARARPLRFEPIAP